MHAFTTSNKYRTSFLAPGDSAPTSQPRGFSRASWPSIWATNFYRRTGLLEIRVSGQPCSAISLSFRSLSQKSNGRHISITLPSLLCHTLWVEIRSKIRGSSIYSNDASNVSISSCLDDSILLRNRAAHPPGSIVSALSFCT